MRRTYVLALALLLCAVHPAFPQVQGGSITGTIADESGLALPGVTVTLTGPEPAVTFLTESTGEYRLTSVPPGTHTITAELPGFATLIRGNVLVSVGSHVEIPLTLKLVPIRVSLTVSGASPITDYPGNADRNDYTGRAAESSQPSRPLSACGEGARPGVRQVTIPGHKP